MAIVSKWSFAPPDSSIRQAQDSRGRLSPQILTVIDGVVLARDAGIYGFVVDAGKTKLYSTIPQPAADVELQAGRAALDYMHSNGITGWL